MTRSPDVLVVSGEPLWPSSHGGRIRTARIVQELDRRLSVRVLAPMETPPPFDVALDPLPDEVPAGRASAALRLTPRLGLALLGPRRTAVLHDVVARYQPRIVLFAHAYLAESAGALGVPVVVDFADIEVRRMASLSRLGPGARSRAGHGIEALKARRWEPRLAGRARVAAATCPADVALLRAWGARAVLVPNGADRFEASPSPAGGPVTFVAGFGYGPNLDAARFLLESVWPRLHRAEPALRLRLVGRHAGRRLPCPEGVEVVPDPGSVERFYDEASLVVAPVRAGGGTQLKVTEALARGRVVVATPFSARAAPPAAGAAVVVADGPDRFADCTLRLWRDTGERGGREAALVARRPVPTWDQACAPLVEALTRAVRTR